MFLDRNASSIVGHFNNVIRQQAHGDVASVAGHGFINTIINDFPDKVVEALLAGATDVHTGALADRIEAF